MFFWNVLISIDVKIHCIYSCFIPELPKHVSHISINWRINQADILFIIIYFISHEVSNHYFWARPCRATQIEHKGIYRLIYVMIFFLLTTQGGLIKMVVLFCIIIIRPIIILYFVKDIYGAVTFCLNNFNNYKIIFFRGFQALTYLFNILSNKGINH